jgi:DNA-binding transcriptional regulator YdaS (Cro superfamily)
VAIDDLPLPVINLLNAIGVPWPYLNEDTISEFAALVREFRSSIEGVHAESSAAVAAITRAHQSVSTEAMQSGWASLTSRHVSELTAGCSVLADALDVAAGYIVAQKAEAIGALVGMAAAFVADQAAAVVTLGLAEAAVPALVAGAEAVVRSLAADIEQYIIGTVVAAAARPLFAKVEEALADLDWSQSGASAGPPVSVVLDPPSVRAETEALRGHAASLQAHAAAFQQGVQGLSF